MQICKMGMITTESALTTNSMGLKRDSNYGGGDGPQKLIRMPNMCINYWPLLSAFLSVTWGLVLDSQTWGFRSGSDGQRICVLRRRPRFDPWVGKMPWRRKWKPIPVFLPGKYHGQRSLLGYSPWGRNKQLSMDTHFPLCICFSLM